MDISNYLKNAKHSLISDILQLETNIRYYAKEGTKMGDYAYLTYLRAEEDDSLLYVRISCESSYSEYQYEIDAENWQKAIDTIFKTDDISAIAEVFKTKTDNFPINIEDIFRAEGIKYYKWAWY